MSEGNTDATARRVVRVHGLIAALGGFIMWAPVLFSTGGYPLMANFLLGAALVVTVSYNAYRTSVGQSPLPLAILAILLAGGAIAAPHLLGVENELVIQANAVAGALAALLAVYTVVGGLQIRRRAATA